MSIIQGDNGTILKRTVKDDAGLVNLTNASVSLVMTSRAGTVTKVGEVTDAVNGACQFVLTAADLAESGMYSVQCRVEFNDGKVFAEPIWKFLVERRLN